MNLTIALPIKNVGTNIIATLECLLKFKCKIIISDNASTDNTSIICNEYAQKYSEIEYYRQEFPVDIYFNFKQCIKIANTKYLMIIPGKDLIDENYINELIKVLENDLNIVLAYTEPRYFMDKKDEYVMASTEKLEEYKHFLVADNPVVRALAMIKYMSYCYQQFGIYRLSVIKEIFEKYDKDIYKFGFDHVFLLELAKRGKIMCVDYVSLYRKSDLNEPIISRIVRYIAFYYTSNFFPKVTLENIYKDYTKEVIDIQLDILASLDFNDFLEKELVLKIGKESLYTKLYDMITPTIYQNYIVENNFDILLEYIYDKKICIFGTGSFANNIFNTLSKSNKIIAFIDSYTEGNRNYNEVPIYNSDWLSINEDTYDLIISSIEGSHDIEIIKNINNSLGVHKMISWKNIILFKEYEKLKGVKNGK